MTQHPRIFGRRLEEALPSIGHGAETMVQGRVGSNGASQVVVVVVIAVSFARASRVDVSARMHVRVCAAGMEY